MKSKTLSVEEANRMLPLLSNIVGDLTSTWSDIIQRRTQLELVDQGQRDLSARELEEAKDEIREELNRKIDKINAYIREVEELGCFVEEFKRGVVNFPAMYVGRKVFLCWKPGDNGVEFWHELDESYSERSPIRKASEFQTH